MRMKLAVYWLTKDERVRQAIRERFKMFKYENVNGESPIEVEDDDMPVLEECQRRGFLRILPKKWCKKGGIIIFTNRN